MDQRDPNPTSFHPGVSVVGKGYVVPRWMTRANGFLRHVGLGIAVVLDPRGRPRLPYRLCRVQSRLVDLDTERAP